ncbi:MAG: hypothetical protein KDE31_02945, partial [Caldilineaceae bacterium]|nr:hypothetical protein [Caldilineaceae bacterium]
IWQLAEEQLNRLKRNDTEDIRELIVEVATSRGLFSIWMKVFEQDIDMRRRLISGFKGTAANCFDANCIAVNRNGFKV